jgi:hypothetical protein
MYDIIILLHPNLVVFVRLLSLFFKNTLFYNNFSNLSNSKIDKKQLVVCLISHFKSLWMPQGFFHTYIFLLSRIIQNPSPGETGLMTINFALCKIYSNSLFSHFSSNFDLLKFFYPQPQYRIH